jgi:hypothetical protein
MMESEPHHVLRIAHAHGNRRRRIEQALAADVDLIEADVRFDGSRIWVRHEVRAPLLPLLYNGRINRFHREGPWALSLGRMFVRLDLAPIPFDELLDSVGDGAGLMLDLKAAPYSVGRERRFVDAMLSMLDSWFHGQIDFCGSWRLLDLVREARPDQRVHYSVDDDQGWQAFARRLGGSASVRAITIQSSMLDDARESFLRREGVEFFVWDIEREAQAQQAIRRGASGIISHHLDVLNALTPSDIRGREAS